jgi:hypothetical protein
MTTLSQTHQDEETVSRWLGRRSDDGLGEVRVEDYIHTSIVYRFVSDKQPPSSLQLELVTNDSIARIRHRVQRVLERVW